MYWSGAGGMTAGGILAWQVAPGWGGTTLSNWVTGPAVVVLAYSLLYLFTVRRHRAILPAT